MIEEQPAQSNLFFKLWPFLALLLVGIGVPLVMRFLSIKYAIPIIIGLTLAVMTFVNRDPLRLFLYMLMAILPIYIAFYLKELPEYIDHPGLLNYPVIFIYDVPFWILVIFKLYRAIIHRLDRIEFPKMLIPLLIYFLPALISTIDAKVPSYSYYELMRTAKMIAVTILVANLIKSRKQLRICLIIIFIGIFIQDIIGLFQYYNPGLSDDVFSSIGIYMGSMNVVPDDPDSAFRVCGTTGYCNALAGYFELMLPIALSLLLFIKMRAGVRLSLIVLLILSYIVFYLTYSRGGLIGMGVAMVIIVIIWFGKLLKKFANFTWVLVISLLLAVLVGYSSYQVVESRLAETGGLLEDQVRAALVRTAYNMVNNKPLFGIGLNNFPEMLHKYNPSSIEFEINYPVHNTYLLITAETGLFGLLFMLWFFWRILVSAYRSSKLEDPELSAVGFGIFAGFCGWLTHNFVAPLYQNWLVNRLALMILIGIVYILPKLASHEFEQENTSQLSLPA